MNERPLRRNGRLGPLVELGVIVVGGMVVLLIALAVALVLQATWLPVAGAVAAIVFLVLVLIWWS